MKVLMILLISMKIIDRTVEPIFVISIARQRCYRNNLQNIYGYYGGINGPFYGANIGVNYPVNRFQSGVREAIFAINEFCDNQCADPPQQDQVNNCIQGAINTGPNNNLIITVLRVCTPGPDLNCNINRNQMNRCFIRRTLNRRRRIVSPQLQRCFRFALNSRTINCLRTRYRILNRLLPLRQGLNAPINSQFYGQFYRKSGSQNLRKNPYKRIRNKRRLRLRKQRN